MAEKHHHSATHPPLSVQTNQKALVTQSEALSPEAREHAFEVISSDGPTPTENMSPPSIDPAAQPGTIQTNQKALVTQQKAASPEEREGAFIDLYAVPGAETAPPAEQPKNSPGGIPMSKMDSLISPSAMASMRESIGRAHHVDTENVGQFAATHHADAQVTQSRGGGVVLS